MGDSGRDSRARSAPVKGKTGPAEVCRDVVDPSSPTVDDAAAGTKVVTRN